VVRLEDLKVSGQAASAALLRTVRAGIANAEGTYELAGWCLNVEGHGVVPVLLLRQSTGGEQRSTEIVLR
jgi:hypothetical protein